MALNFLKRGADAQAAIRKAETEAETRKAQYAIRRFWIPTDGESTLTFLDGALTSDGLLDTVSYLEHQVYMAGSWRNWFPCVAETEPCPVCQSGNFASVVSLFTVIDHSEYKDKMGKVHKNEKRLFVAKRDTLKRLQKLSAKRGGLRGWTVSVSRTGDKSPSVGTDFDFIEQNSLADVVAKYKLAQADAAPFDYGDGKTVRYFTAEQLRALGFGTQGLSAPTSAAASHADEDEGDEAATYDDTL